MEQKKRNALKRAGGVVPTVVSPLALSSLTSKPENSSGLTLEDWRFIDKERYSCKISEKPYLLDYELAREGVALKISYPSAATWQAVFPEHFPKTPFLIIPKAVRDERVKAAFRLAPGTAPLADPTAKYRGFTYTSRSVLTPEFQAQVEALHDELRDELKVDHCGGSARTNLAGDVVPRDSADRLQGWRDRRRGSPCPTPVTWWRYK